MENLNFSLNATMPIFFTMVIGWILKKMRIIDDHFVERTNKFAFRAAMPMMLFEDLSSMDFFEVWDTSFVLFCFFVTLASILIVAAISLLLKDRSVQGEFIQASYRSSSALLGIAFIQNIYGNAGMSPMMVIGTIPLYNISAVIILSFMKPNREPLDKKLIKKTLHDIITNPIIGGIVIGMAWSIMKLPMPAILGKTVKNLAVLATPLGLIAMGAAFDLKNVTSYLKQTLLASFIKLVLLAAIFLPIAISLGFRMDKLVAVLVMLGTATTVSCYIMARNMGYEGVMTSNAVGLTTLFSAFTLTGWLFLLRSLGLI